MLQKIADPNQPIVLKEMLQHLMRWHGSDTSSDVTHELIVNFNGY